MQQFRLGADRPSSTPRQQRGSLENKKLKVCQQWGCAEVSADCSVLAEAQPAVSWDTLFPFSHRCQSCFSSSLLIFEPLDTQEILANRRETRRNIKRVTEHVMHEEPLEKLGSFSLRREGWQGSLLVPDGEHRWRQTVLKDMQ